MTLQEFSRDVIPIMNTALAFIGLVSILLLWVQIKQRTKWYKFQGQAEFLNRPFEKIEADAHKSLSPYGLDLRDYKETIPREKAVEIVNDENAYFCIKTYLNAYEDLAAGVRIGFVDEDFAFALESARLIIAWNKFREVIDYLRKKAGDEEIYIEIENVAEKWIERTSIDSNKRDQARKDAKKGMGAQKKGLWFSRKSHKS